VDRPQALLYLSLMLYFLLANLTESSWLTTGPNPNWIVVGLAIFAMSRQLLEQRLRATHGDPQAAATPAPQNSPAPQDLIRRYRTMPRRRR
jgi:hypothetical protein